MTLALVAVDLDLTADVRIDFTTQITLDLVVTLKVITQRNQLLIRQILDANVRIDTGRGKRFLGTSTTNTNARTRKGPKRTVAGKKKATK